MSNGWMFGLISPDDVVRGRALARHRDLVASRSEPTIFTHLEAPWRRETRNTTVSVEQWRFVSLYLRWEALFPDEWRSSDLWSPWSRKEAVLEHLGRTGAPAKARREAADLLIDVVHRSYRCKDWMYPALVRHVADADFRNRLATLADAGDPLVVLRARFLLDLAGRPELKVTRKTWRRWLEDQK